MGGEGKESLFGIAHFFFLKGGAGGGSPKQADMSLPCPANFPRKAVAPKDGSSRRHAVLARRGAAPRTTHQSPLGLDQGSVLPVHLVVEPAGIAQVVASAISPPERGGCGPTVDTLPAF